MAWEGVPKQAKYLFKIFLNFMYSNVDNTQQNTVIGTDSQNANLPETICPIHLNIA